MSEGFKLEIINPEKSFLLKDGVSEVVVPAFEGDMGILKDHISIISFLKHSYLLRKMVILSLYYYQKKQFFQG